MLAVVTGATGCLGMALCRLLKEQKEFHVIGLGRNKALGQQVSALGVEFRTLDLEDEYALQEVCKESSVIFHCAALSSPWGKFQAFYETNVRGTQHVVQATPKGSRLIYVSSPSIYFNFKSQYDIKEDASLASKAANFYIETKREAEKILKHAHLNHGLDVITIRPRGIFGPYDRSILPRIMALYKKGKVPVFGEGRQFIDISYVDNVADSLIKAANAPPIFSGNIYNITNDQPMALIDILKLLFEQLNLSVQFKCFPYYGLKPIAHLFNLVYKLPFIKSEPPITPYTLGVMTFGQTLNIERAKVDLKYKANLSIEEGIKRYVQWVKQVC